MSSAAACASARRKRASNGSTTNTINATPVTNEIKNKEVNNDIQYNDFKNKNSFINLIVNHSNKIKNIEEDINNIKINSTIINKSDNNKIDIDGDILKIMREKQHDIDNKLDKLKDLVIENFNVYLESSKTIIEIQNKVGNLEDIINTMAVNKTNIDNISDINIFKELLSSCDLNNENILGKEDNDDEDEDENEDNKDCEDTEDCHIKHIEINTLELDEDTKIIIDNLKLNSIKNDVLNNIKPNTICNIDTDEIEIEQ